MDIEILKLTLKTLANDARLRILNLLKEKELTVKDMCMLLGVSQPTVSKHLQRLLMLKIVKGKREGNCIYYKFDSSSEYGKIAELILSEMKNFEVFKHDEEKMHAGAHA